MHGSCHFIVGGSANNSNNCMSGKTSIIILFVESVHCRAFLSSPVSDAGAEALAAETMIDCCT